MQVFVGKIVSRQVQRFAVEKPGSVEVTGWFHVVNDTDGDDGVAPVHVAADAETLEMGGGDRLWPGDSTDLYGAAVFVAPPRQGPLPRVSIELREKQTFIHRDGMGGLVASLGAKGGFWKLTPKVWQNVLPGVVGTYAVLLRAEGGAVWVGTHMAMKYPDGSWRPPTDMGAGAGVPWRIEKGKELFVPGNPGLWAWTDEEEGSLRALKFEHGWQFGGYG